ncbi:MAG TPA: DUF2600 family protein [Candidatus Baltobacteraceae bacterium]|nr:DUF2600 family protein [Candidatus Baltobacteraceae bacterium]
MAALDRDLNATLAGVFTRPSRLRRLLAVGPRGWIATARFLGRVVPPADRELGAIRARAANIPDDALRAQALASIDEKAYHVQGGCIFATFLPRASARRYIALVAALETIYDYLDNLCDRLPDVPASAYATLHEALRDALDARRPLADYYRNGPERDDGGYLRFLVESVRARVAELPSLAGANAQLAESVAFYAELQSFKHLAKDVREPICQAWYERHRARFPGLQWWEFAAACGSSLPVFALLYLASQEGVGANEFAATYDVYFPNVSAVHILLDYYIDRDEDRTHGELNFFDCYPSSEGAVQGLAAFIRSAAGRVGTLPFPERHRFVVEAMCVFYLTHPKVFAQRQEHQSAALLAALR